MRRRSVIHGGRPQSPGNKRPRIPDKCTILSLGLGDDITFEKELQKMTNSRCRILGLDSVFAVEKSKTTRFRIIRVTKQRTSSRICTERRNRPNWRTSRTGRGRATTLWFDSFQGTVHPGRPGRSQRHRPRGNTQGGGEHSRLRFTLTLFGGGSCM